MEGSSGVPQADFVWSRARTGWCTVMTGRQDGTCPDCGRAVLEEGVRERVETAWDRDKIDNFSRWVDEQLSSRKRAARRNADLIADLAVRLEEYCDTGSLEIPRELNTLVEDELWEFKVDKLRVPFFRVSSSRPGTVRVTHHFFKGTRFTPRAEIDKALAIKREDLKR